MMSMQPLTHHEILELVGPFARRGRHVDLAASNRLERRLLFKPIEHGAQPQAPSSMQEVLQLEQLASGSFRLTRLLRLGCGLTANLQASGADPGALLAQIEAIPLEQQLRAEASYAIARDYRIEESAGRPVAVLTRGVVQVDGLHLNMHVSPVRGVAAEITLQPAAGAPPDLPQDLLAVMGWDWARLIRGRDGWKSKLRLRGGGARRSRTAEAALDQAAVHLARTLAEPPARFHDRWLRARWGVVFRRAIPLLTFVVIVAVVLVARRHFAPPNLAVLMLLYHVPTALIAASFMLQELPQYEIPPLPRRCTVPSWAAAAPPARARRTPAVWKYWRALRFARHPGDRV